MHVPGVISYLKRVCRGLGVGKKNCTVIGVWVSIRPGTGVVFGLKLLTCGSRCGFGVTVAEGGFGDSVGKKDTEIFR